MRTIGKAFRIWGGVLVMVLAMIVLQTSHRASAAVPLNMPSMFSDYMMLQQQKPIQVWGKGEPSTQVSVVLKRADNNAVVGSASATVDANGRWEATLAQLSASYTEYTMTVSSGTQQPIVIQHILVGEIWVAGGQSNMNYEVQFASDWEDALANANNARIRLFTQKSVPLEAPDDEYSYTPLDDIPGGQWKPGTSADNVRDSSAVAYSFAKKLFADLNAGSSEVPVAIINTATGSTSISAWMSRETQENDPYLNVAPFRITEEEWNDRTEYRFDQMTAMYNHKIAPFKGYNVRGILWYQGENNMGESPTQYMRHALPALVDDWSAVFGSPNNRLPIIFSLLAPHYKDSYPISLDGYPHTAMASTNEDLMDAYKDLVAAGDTAAFVTIYDLDPAWTLSTTDPNHPPYAPYPIHPITKKPVGERMEAAAKSLVYGQSGVPMGPAYDSMTVVNGKIRIDFSQAGTGLAIAGGGVSLRGFAISGPDHRYVEAQAVILDADTVEVWQESVPNPTAVTYAYAAMNRESNLVNSANLYAAPFRTDRTARRTTIDGQGAWYWAPMEWMRADNTHIWAYPNNSTAASVQYAWVASPAYTLGSSAFSLSSAVKTEGQYSIKADYTTDGNGFAGFGPATTYPSITPVNHPVDYYLPLAKFDRLTVDVYNPDARAKTLHLMFKDASGGLYYLGSTSELTPGAVIPAGPGWCTVSFDLHRLYQDFAGNTPIFDPHRIRASSARVLQFVVRDGTASASGSLHVDNVRFDFGSATADLTLMDMADRTTGWSYTGSSLAVDTADKKAGAGSLALTGTGFIGVAKSFAEPVNRPIDEGNGRVEMWLYVSNTSLMTTCGLSCGKIEVTSSGMGTSDGYSWALSALGLQNGWNAVSLPLSSAVVTGNPNPNGLNYVRVNQQFTSNATIKVNRIAVGGNLPSGNPSGDLTAGKTATASSTAGLTFQAYKANDGIGNAADPGNVWASAENRDVGAWWRVDLGQTTAIGDVRLQFRGSSGTFVFVPQSITFQVSNDGVNWMTAISRSTNVPAEGTAYSGRMYTYHVEASGRYLRLLFEDGTQNATYKYVEFTEIDAYPNENLALNKSASASSEETGLPASGGIDGIHASNSVDTGNVWASALNQDIGSWWQVDLGSAKDIGTVKLQFRNRSGLFFAIPKNITFQVSSDGSTWTTAVSKSTNVPGEGAAYSETPYSYQVNAAGRYLRLLFEDGSKNASFRYIELAEVGVYAASIAPGKSVSASSEESASYAATKGNDGVYNTADPANAWASQSNKDVMSWWKIDLGQTTAITTVKLQFRGGSGGYFCVPKNITFQVSDDGTHWTTAVSKSTEVPLEASTYSAEPYTYHIHASGRYLRLLFEDGTQNNTYKFTEFTEAEVYR